MDFTLSNDYMVTMVAHSFAFGVFICLGWKFGNLVTEAWCDIFSLIKSLFRKTNSR